jgi:aminopeptidase N
MKLPRRSRAPQKGDAVKRSYAEDRLGYLTVEESAELEHLRGVAPAQVAAHADDEPPRFPERIAELKAKHRSRTDDRIPALQAIVQAYETLLVA